MKNILLPTDFSDNSWNAISYASQLFKDEECTFYLLNTYKLMVYGAEFTVQNPSEFGLLESIKSASTNGLKRFSERIESDFNNPKHTVIEKSVFDSLTSAMESLHNELKVDFIVMGTKGATGAKKVLFGSNTVDVLKDARCPVLAIPEDYDFEQPDNILFPSDYNISFGDKHLKPIKGIAHHFDSKVNSLHVFQDNRLTERQLENRNLLERYFEGIAFELHFVKNQKIPKAVEEFQIKAGINFLVMINNKHSFFENLFFKNKINEIGFDLEIPFLVIPT